MFSWFELHDKLAGWAQFFGAMLAIAITYFTAFVPTWQRKKQLSSAAVRLLSHGYEMLESYHRTSAHFMPNALSLRIATLTMSGVADEINRFPVYELQDQGNRSTSRALVAISHTLLVTKLVLDDFADRLGKEDGTAEDQNLIREFVHDRMKEVEGIISGRELHRPTWPMI